MFLVAIERLPIFSSNILPFSEDHHTRNDAEPCAGTEERPLADDAPGAGAVLHAGDADAAAAEAPVDDHARRRPRRRLQARRYALEAHQTDAFKDCYPPIGSFRPERYLLDTHCGGDPSGAGPEVSENSQFPADAPFCTPNKYLSSDFARAPAEFR